MSDCRQLKQELHAVALPGDAGINAWCLCKVCCVKLPMRFAPHDLKPPVPVGCCLLHRVPCHACLSLRRSGQRTSSSKSSRHMRKVSSGLQFDIELTSEGQSRNSSSNNLLGRRSILRLPPGVAVAALTEAKDPLESSIGVQVGRTSYRLWSQRYY